MKTFPVADHPTKYLKIEDEQWDVFLTSLRNSDDPFAVLMADLLANPPDPIPAMPLHGAVKLAKLLYAHGAEFTSAGVISVMAEDSTAGIPDTFMKAFGESPSDLPSGDDPVFIRQPDPGDVEHFMAFVAYRVKHHDEVRMSDRSDFILKASGRGAVNETPRIISRMVDFPHFSAADNVALILKEQDARTYLMGSDVPWTDDLFDVGNGDVHIWTGSYTFPCENAECSDDWTVDIAVAAIMLPDGFTS